MQHTNCLNCSAELAGKFCSGCGQKADTHRINAKHFIMHDLVHGVWHLDRGLLYTLKSLFTRPGYMAKDYIEGKRVQYYNIFYLLLLMFPVIFVIQSWTDKLTEHTFSFKASLLTFIPIFALLGFLFFKRMKYNFFEHVIAAGVITFWNLIMTMVISFYPPVYTMTAAYALMAFHYSHYYGIPLIIYYQLTREKYKLPGIIWRALLIVWISGYFHSYFVEGTKFLISYFKQ